MDCFLTRKIVLISTVIFCAAGCITIERYHKVALPLKSSLISTITAQLEAYEADIKDESIRKGLSEAFATIKEHNIKILEGPDQVKRPVGVGLQTVYEHSLHSLLLEDRTISAVAIIHTPSPATPLVSAEKKVDPEVMAAGMVNDKASEKTILDRTVTIRNLARLDSDQMKLYIAYPTSGRSKRTEEQLEVYNTELANQENKALHDLPLEDQKIPNKLVGASYIVTSGNKEEQPFFFGIRAVQAIDADDKTEWKLSFGELNKPIIEESYKEVKQYLERSANKSKSDLQLP